MAKRIDESKIERIRTATVAIIARDGVTHASVAAIAKEAGVSAGYLYMHYAGKVALINDLIGILFDTINEKISLLIEEKKGLRHIIQSLAGHIIRIGEDRPDRIKFLIMLLNDFSLTLNPELVERIDVLAEELMEMAQNDPTVRRGIGKKDIFVAMIGIPMQYLSAQFSGIVSKEDPASQPQSHIVEAACNIIFKD